MKKFIYAIIGIVFLAIVAGFFVIGSPRAERDRRFDEQRVSDLQNLQSLIIYYWQGKQKLPVNLSDAASSIPTDPETGGQYSYKITGELSFELCAKFSRENKFDPNLPYDYSIGYKTPALIRGNSWDHPAGDYCFAYVIDKDFYKPLK